MCTYTLKHILQKYQISIPEIFNRKQKFKLKNKVKNKNKEKMLYMSQKIFFPTLFN